MKTIGQMIYELERDLEMYRQADATINKWKEVYMVADENTRMKMMKEMLYEMGFSMQEVDKIINSKRIANYENIQSFSKC